jgi:SAM-dependent methyltransferase
VSFDFQAYLDAKYALDSRSLNRDVLAILQQCLTTKHALRCLDLGTGTGAMPNRLIELDLDCPIEITGLDIDLGLLKTAKNRLRRRLSELGFRTECRNLQITARRGERTIRIRLECASALDWNPSVTDAGHDLITAHAFMDLVPLQPLVKKILDLLSPGGLFYSTLNYDGETVLVPLHSDEDFEKEILEHYDRSMEIRRITGMPTGGSHCGRRLISFLLQEGFAMSGYGSSDWNITPVDGSYRDGEAFCLESLLQMIRGEASGCKAIDQEDLAVWYSDRLRALGAGLLGMVVHQIDILAVKPRGALQP